MTHNIKYYCTTPTDDLFVEIKQRFGVIDTREDYIFIDNGSKILAVAHLDTVLDSMRGAYDHFDCGYYPKKNQFIVNSIALDDRLGVFTILETLLAYGLKYDILLTKDEEIGASTAANFKTTKKYNWIFSFDRRGMNPVCYQYSDPDWKKTLEAVGYKVDYGSFSDICYLGHLGAKALNCGVAYNFEHTNNCHVIWSEYQTCIKMFRKFYDKYKKKRFPHKETAGYSRYSGYYGDGYSNQDAYDWRMGTYYLSQSSSTALSKYTQTTDKRCINCNQWLFAHEKKDKLCDECKRDDKL